MQSDFFLIFIFLYYLYIFFLNNYSYFFTKCYDHWLHYNNYSSAKITEGIEKTIFRNTRSIPIGGYPSIKQIKKFIHLILMLNLIVLQIK